MENVVFVPVMKAKQGELSALEQLSNNVKEKIIPLLEITPPTNVTDSWVYLKNKAQKIAKAWSTGKPLWVDARLFFARSADPNKKGLLRNFFKELMSYDLMVIPVVGLTGHKEYKDVCFEYLNNGLCFRLTADELAYEHFNSVYERELNDYDLKLNECDVIIDLPTVMNGSINLALEVATKAINVTIKSIDKYRMVVVAGSSFPLDLSGFEPGEHLIERKEWLFYKQLRNRLLRRVPIYGDYGIASEVYRELDPKFITVSASIRYTIEDYWIVLRGKSLKKHGYNQYKSLCEELISKLSYYGASYSNGDEYIFKCALGNVTNGNPQIWIKNSLCHHVTLVVDLVSKLP